MRKAKVIAALERLGVEAPCPACDANSWGGIGPEGEERDVHVQAIDPDDQMTPGWGLKCSVLICTNCGFVRLHANEALERALEP